MEANVNQEHAEQQSKASFSKVDSQFQERVIQTAELLNQAIRMVQERIIGNHDIIKKLLIAVLAEGHVLLEGVPGIAKTKTTVELAKALGLQSNRVQCTPDLLPSDITGMTVFRPDTGKFEVHKGPVFSHILIADEINRTPPKVQSALLEAMAEKQVTIFGTTEKLPSPFFVMATQNPIEQEGTYPLPEAQLDRFMFKLIMNPLGFDEEKKIIGQLLPDTNFIADSRASTSDRKAGGDLFIRDAIEIASNIYVDPAIVEYIAHIVLATRDMKQPTQLDSNSPIRLGASPRASLALLKGARAHALLEGRTFITPQDVKLLAKDILRHRIIVSFEAEAQGIDSVQIIENILSTITTP